MFNWKLESIKRMFGLKKSNKGITARKLNIENLEERIECATKVWDGSVVGQDPVVAAGGDPTFSSFMAGYSQTTDSTSSLAQNWASTFGQVSLPNNGDTLVFPTITQSTPGTNTFGPLGGVTVNVINDMSPDSNGNLAGYLRDTVTGKNLVNPLINVDSIVFNGTGYFVYGRDNPQFGPANVAGLIPPGTTLTIAPTSVYNPEYFFPGASTTGYTWFNPAVPAGVQATVNTATVVVNATGGVVTIPVLVQGSGYTSVPNVTITSGTGTGATARANILNGRVTSITVLTPGIGYSSAPGTTGTFFNGTITIAAPNQGTLGIDPSSPVNPITNISTTPAVPLNIQTSILANYNVALANRNIVNPDGTTTPNANWNYMPINLGNPNAPEGSAFLINVNQEGTWLIMNSDLENTSNPSGTTPGNYTLINDVNNNKIIKNGLGILVFESSNQYTGTTVVQQGLLIVSDNSGLGDALTNSNVEVYGGTLLIGVDRYNSKQSQNFNTTTIANRNLVLYGGDGYIPTIAAVAGSSGNTLTIPVGTPMGELNGRDGLFATPHQWDGTVTLNSNSSLITQSATPSDAYGLTGGSVDSISIISGGAGYTSAPTVTMLAPGQATAGAAAINLGTITSILVATPGSGYITAPIVTISGGGTTVTKNATATATILNGFVTAITITNPGAGYTVAPTVNIQAPGQALAGSVGIASGRIISIPVSAAGSGYTTVPIVSISGGGGTGAAAVANIVNGVVTSITITNGGSGYTSQPTISVQAPGQAVAGTPTFFNNQITSVPVLSPGYGYTSAPVITFTGGGATTGATATANLTASTIANPTGDPSIGQDYASYTELNGVISGAAGFRKWGTGSVELTQPNTFSGDVVVFDGFLNIQNPTGLGLASSSNPKDIIVREMPASLVSATNLQLAGALTLGDEVNGGQNLVFSDQYDLTIQNANPNTVSNNGPDQSPIPAAGTSGLQGLGAFQVVSPNNNPNKVEWQGDVNIQTNASIGGTPNSKLIISGQITSTLPIAATAVPIIGGGEITTINVLDGSSGYLSAPTVTISGGNGNGATATATLLNGKVDVINVLNGGSGYSGATAGTPTIALRRIVTIPVLSGSSGYLTAPLVTITDTSGTGATATATLKNGVVTAITVTNGGIGYSATPAITIAPPPIIITPTITISAPGVQLEKRGAMDIILDNDNTSTFQGSWLVSNGNLILQNNGALGNATSINVSQQLSPTLPALSGSGSIQVDGYGLDIKNNVTIQGTGYNGFGALQSIGQNTWSGTISVAGTASVGVGIGSELIVSGQITQSSGANKTPINVGTPVFSAAGVLTSIPVNSGGSGYVSVPTVSITGGGGTGATATATVVNGVVTAITVTNGGTGYTTAPTVTVQTSSTQPNNQLVKNGAGTVILSTAQNSLTLPVLVQEGTLIVQAPGNLGAGSSGSSQVTVSTSVPVNSATLALDGGTAGKLSISNRTLNLDGAGVSGAGALRSISGNNTWAGNINLSGTSQVAYVGVDTDTLTLSGNISGGSSTLQKTGAGDLIINNQSAIGNTHKSTVVGAGTVYQLSQDNVPVFINTSGTLTGNGKIGVLNMTAGQNGTVTPGTQTSSVAVLTTSGISAQSSIGVFSFDLNTSGTVAGTAYDQLAVNGTVNLSGSPVLNVKLNFNPIVRGNSYTIISNDGSDPVVGTFSGQAEGSLVTVLDAEGDSVSYRISYVGGTGNDVTLTCVGVLTTNVLTSSDVDNLTQYGEAVTFTSTISALTGTVNRGTVTYFDQGVSIGQAPLVNGIANFTTTTLSVNGSPHVITSTFVGQGIFGDSNSNIIAQSVNKSSSTIAVTTNAVTTYSSDTAYGTNLPLTITATVTPQYAGGSATGQVRFRIDGIPQPLQTISATVTDPTTGATTATLLTSISTTGFHQIDAQYVGDSNINGSAVSPIFNQEILTTAITTLGLVSSRNPADRLATITFTASVTNPIIPSESTIGLVQFLDNGVALGAPVAVSNNVATYSTSTLTGGRHTITANYLGSPNLTTTRYFSSSSATIYQAVTATSNLVITGTNEGGGPQVNVYNLLTQETTNFFAFAPSFRGGVRVASGDVTGDGIADVIVAAGPGGGPQVNVYDGTSLQLVHSFYAYNAAFDDGIFVAVGDVNGDGYADIITGAGQGGGPHVQVFSGQNYSNIASFFAYNPAFTGGISVASGDVNGDGYSDVVVGAGPGGGPHVLAVSGFQLSQGTQVVLASFFAFDPGINQGVFVAAGDYNGDLVGDIVVAAGPGGSPHVKVFNGSGTSLIDTFFAYDINFAGGLSIAMADIDNDGLAEIVTAPYTNGGPEVKVFRYQKGQLYNFYAYDPLFTGGVFVG
ncbi:MAG: Ig-like domain repeat protein [Planctomycetota bacterium]